MGYIILDLIGLLLLALMGSDSWRVREWATKHFDGMCVSEAVAVYGLDNPDREIRRRARNCFQSGRVSVLLGGDFASPACWQFEQARRWGMTLSWEQPSPKVRLWRCRFKQPNRDTP